MAHNEKFDAVTFLSQYPPQSVDENEVCMSFHNDQDAIDFSYWWVDEGSAMFAKWIDEQKKAADAH